ncbi:gas vesicle protein [Staphylococcus auricularis]|uniref:YtxH domain-containing protein n=1 Tax=Staphylococcus auricularis TaxID=29379 RepID=A0AAP8TSS9_9STAP|nr:hypothetical protein [Staphylococcus auricularis]MBM0868194.1 YtxH domain-containing protein [Staphylococcus auricularis]MDC6327015.1 YtxH domain-containing protein [Staphylococcus auricularis]MDN4532892.1 YtxH domain-containing protein [Staphylococcus auricularis]PNZ66774.1 hypothetical protein CD158_07740 [Staphylococcus auricularis]QPT06890.1 YtxH domain-containing protein [Staphylococcus auricularis]
MKPVQFLLGVGAGVATGVGVFLMNKQNQQDQANHTATQNQTTQPVGADAEFNRDVETIKQSITDITNYISQIKSEGKQFASTIGDDVKSMIGNFQSDIKPNIEQIQSHIENLQNRGEEISKAFDKEK